MSEFKDYVKPAVQPMRPYVKGEDMTSISVGEGVKVAVGGMIAHDPKNPSDQWFIPKKFFQDNYVESQPTAAAKPKSLSNTTVNGAKKNVSDLVTYGNGDTFQLICKASSKNEGWMKSTKACEVPGLGCIVQVTTQQGVNVAEAITFVPGVGVRATRGDKTLGREFYKL